jgi:hypothetical protein
VWLVRDEVANMVWGIEKTVPLASGDSQDGLEAARQLLAYYQALIGAPAAGPPPSNAALRYQVMNTVPENWIPFVPVHVDCDNRSIQLQRAALPRILAGPRPAGQGAAAHDTATPGAGRHDAAAVLLAGGGGLPARSRPISAPGGLTGASGRGWGCGARRAAVRAPAGSHSIS